jgi:magnesium transporter
VELVRLEHERGERHQNGDLGRGVRASGRQLGGAAMTGESRQQIDALREALEQGDGAGVDALIAELHPADLAELIDELDDDRRIELFRRIPPATRAETLSEVAPEAWADLLESVEPHEVGTLFESLEVDDAADILGEISHEDAREILESLEPEESREIAALMKYDAESAGGIMTTELIAVPAHLTCDEAILAVRQRGREVQTFNTIYVVDDENRLLGTASLRDLILADGQQPVVDIMDTDTVRVRPTVDQEEVARLISKYNLVSIPVCDEFEHLLGRITVDDVIDIIEAEMTEDIFRLSGVGEEEEEHATALEIVRSRAPWLFITLGTSGLGALVVAQFEQTIQRIAFIAVFMPVVAAMAGNSAIQATTVAVRRLALARGSNPARLLARELAAGLVIGGLIALVLGMTAGAWQRSAVVGLVVGGSMWAAMALGVLWGAAFPLLLDRLGLDPAVSSSVFLTTMTDLVSFLLILGSASYFLTRWL